MVSTETCPEVIGGLSSALVGARKELENANVVSLAIPALTASTQHEAPNTQRFAVITQDYALKEL